MVWLSIAALALVLTGAPEHVFTAELDTRASTLEVRGLPTELAEWTTQTLHERGVRYYEINAVEGGDIARAHRALLGLFELQSGRVTSTPTKLELVGTTSRPRTKRMLELAFGEAARIELVPDKPFIESVNVRAAIRVGPQEIPVAGRVVRFDDVAEIALYRPWWTNYRPNGDLAPVVIVGPERTADDVTKLTVEVVDARDAREAISKAVSSRHGHHFVVDSDGVIYQTADVLRTMELRPDDVAIAMVTAPESCRRATSTAQRTALAELRRALQARFPTLVLR